MNNLKTIMPIAVLSIFISSPVLAAEMLREEVHHKSHEQEQVEKKVKDCDCQEYSDEALKEYKKDHPMNSNILRDKR